MKNSKTVAMLLAGGQGSRLKELTKNTAKPAVPYGGKYRIIDFALSNASNSGIKDIGILTQYKPHQLNDHIGLGSPWNLNNNRQLKILSPYTTEEEGRWYKGTANAIYENLNYLDSLNPQYVLILSADHIYKMDYEKMIDFHIKNNGDATISVIEVPWEEALRFGIMDVKDNRITHFEEKPNVPKNNLASMGIYVFNWKVLREYLIEDAGDEKSSNDFGKDIIPKMLKDNMRMFAYLFKGYWKDVGTVQSYWQANMDLLQRNSLDIHDRTWRINTRNRHLPPHYIAPEAEVSNTMINEGCIIKGSINKSVLSSGIMVEEGAHIESSVIFPKAVIKSGAKIRNAIIMEGVVVNENAVIGSTIDDKIRLVSKDRILIQ